jgi:uncharacterized SAM-binding protein YcdF (DUF218 family)
VWESLSVPEFLTEILNPYAILVLLVAAALANVWWKHREVRRRLLLVIAPLVALMLLSLQPVEYVLLGTLEWANPPLARKPDDAGAIVVLAGGVRAANARRLRDELDEATTHRCLCASTLYHEGTACRVLVSGGKAADQPGPPCAQVMRGFLIELGVKEADVIVEDSSRTTYENAVESHKLLQERGIHKIVLVTDATHMVRAAACFRHQGLEVVPAACHQDATEYTPGLVDLVPNPTSVRSCQRVWHEWLGLAWYRLRGRI